MKVAIYCRLSEEDRNKQSETDDSESIQNQKSMLISHAIEKGWEIYKVYSDDDYTGSDRNRPEFKQMLTDAQCHKFNIILCKSQSRFTRELELVEKYIHGLFPIWGVRFISLVDNADTDVKGNKKSRQINGLVNEWYLEDMSENIKSVLTNKRKNGSHIGAFALYGYMKDPEQKGHLIIDEDAAAVVREVFDLFLQGYGKTNIARILNDRGIPNPTEYKRLKGLRYKQPKSEQSTLWKYYTVQSMLVNEIYIGNMVQGKYGSISYKSKINKPRPKEQWYIVENTHEPIIDRETWERTQALIEQKAKPFITGEIGLFSRKARCLYCGYQLRTSKNRDRHYLKCETRNVSKHSCSGAFIPALQLEKIVLDELRKLSENYLDKDELESKVSFNSNLKEQKHELEGYINLYQNKISEASKCLRELYLDKVKGLITESDYMEFSKTFGQDKAHYEQLLSDSMAGLERINEKMSDETNREKLIEEYINLKELSRPVVDTLIDYISVGRREKGSKQPPIEIHWNF